MLLLIELSPRAGGTYPQQLGCVSLARKVEAPARRADWLRLIAL